MSTSGNGGGRVGISRFATIDRGRMTMQPGASSLIAFAVLILS